MRKKGFTLVELLAVLAVMAVLLVLIVPTVIRVINDSKQRAYDTQINSIKTGARFYIEDERDTIDELKIPNASYYLTLGELETQGYIELPITNPLTDQAFDPNMTLVEVKVNYNKKLIYNVIELGNSISFNKLYGGTGDEWAFSALIETSDGGYVFGCSSPASGGDVTEEHMGDFSDVWIVKVDAEGNIVWDEIIGSFSNDDSVYEIFETSDGGFLLIGDSYGSTGDITDGNQGWMDIFIIKLDKDGNKLWDKTYGGDDGDYWATAIENKKGNYVIVTATQSETGDFSNPIKGGTDAWVFEIDKGGNKLWDRNYGGADWEFPTDIIEVSTGGYLVVGYTDSTDGDITDGNNGADDGFVIKIDETGNIIWDKTYGGLANDWIRTVIELPNNNYLLGGETASSDGDISLENEGGDDFFLLKIDSTGNKVWGETYGGSGNEIVQNMFRGRNGNIFLYGWTSSLNGGDITDGNNGGTDYLIMEINPDGLKIQDKTYGCSGNNENDIDFIPTSDGGYLLGGFAFASDGDVTESLTSGEYWLLKLKYDLTY